MKKCYRKGLRRAGGAALTLLVLFALSFGGLPSVAIPDRLPFDLVVSTRDVNGFDQNPQWAWQLTHADLPDPNSLCFSQGTFAGCTNDPVQIDEAKYPYLATCRYGNQPVKGHINWPRPATYSGTINWSEHALDNDYCFELTPPDGKSGLTVHNNGTLHLEFHGGETVAHFATDWWKKFRAAAGNRFVGSGSAAGPLVNGKRAVVIGMLGLDCVHGCYTELHPVYALAINIETRVDPVRKTVDEFWAIFARNWGGEGWCSTRQYPLKAETGSTEISILLPGRFDQAGAALPYDVIPDGTRFLASHAQVGGPQYSKMMDGVRLSFRLPPASVQARIHGELHLRWTFNEPPAAPAVGASALAAAGNREVEEPLLAKQLSADAKQTIARRYAEPESADAITLTMRPAETSRARAAGNISRAKAKTRLGRPWLTIAPVLDAEKANRDQLVLDLLPKPKQ